LQNWNYKYEKTKPELKIWKSKTGIANMEKQNRNSKYEKAKSALQCLEI
jgi:hypothetical protein